MIRAAKDGPLAALVAAYVGCKVRRAFRGVWLRGALPPADARLVVYANHTSFWDGFACHLLCRAGGWDAYCMMEEANLARYRFLRRLGAFSVRRGDAQAAIETLRYAVGLLRRPGRAVVVFPEGVLRPWTGALQPLERGVEVLARRAGARCLPVAIRYRFFEHELPDLLLAVGEAHDPAPLAELATRLAAAVAEVGDTATLADFTPLLRGRRSVVERWDAARGLREAP
ncbi:MAG: lysophospholipid acyltransferase family protein [bacterium]|nr:lysophospholipid acyltransferase family protein [bacterium]